MDIILLSSTWKAVKIQYTAHNTVSVYITVFLVLLNGDFLHIKSLKSCNVISAQHLFKAGKKKNLCGSNNKLMFRLQINVINPHIRELFNFV